MLEMLSCCPNSCVLVHDIGRVGAVQRRHGALRLELTQVVATATEAARMGLGSVESEMRCGIPTEVGVGAVELVGAEKATPKAARKNVVVVNCIVVVVVGLGELSESV